MASAQVLPKELRLTAPPTMPQARSYLFKQQATMNTYSAGNQNVVTINIPRLQRSYLTKDSYLKFRVGLDWNNLSINGQQRGFKGPYAPVFDTCGAFGLFDRIEVYDYLGSTLLESTSGHGQLLALLMDTQCSSEELLFHYGTNSGTKGGRVIVDKETGAYAVPTTGAYTLTGSNCGHVFTNPINREDPSITDPTDGNYPNNGTVIYYEFAIPLFSFLGLLSQKFAPLHNGYTINLTLNPVAHAFGFSTAEGTLGSPGNLATAPTSYELSNVFMCCQILELGPVAESMLISSTQGQPFVVPSKAYRNYIGLVSAQTPAYRLDLNLNVASLTNILYIMRETAYQNDIRFKSLSSRIRNYLQSWYFQYGSTILPQTSGIQCSNPPGIELDANRGGINEAYCELMKARHNLNAANFNSNISRRNYWIDDALTGIAAEHETPNADGAKSFMALTVDNVYDTGKFAAGLDLELVSGRSNDLVCGMNTNGMNTSINLTFSPDAVSHVKEARVDCWCEYDSFINVSPGIATTVSF